MGDQWYFITGGKQNGPVSRGVLNQMVAEGRLHPTDMVWTDTLPAWQPANSLKGLFPARPAPPPAPAPSVRRAARDVVRGFQDEGNAQWWAFWVAVVAAGAAANFSWQWTGNSILTIAAAVLALCAGAWIGYNCAKALTVLFVLGIVVVVVLIFINHQQGQKALEEAKKKATFDPKSLATTLLWMEVQGTKVTAVDAKKNEVLSKEAMDVLSRTLAKAQGSEVQWQATVESITPTAVTLQIPSIGSGYALTFKAVAASQLPSKSEVLPQGLVLPITPEQSRKLVAGQAVTLSGRVLTCQAERGGAYGNPNQLAFTLVVAEAKVVD